MSLERRKDNKTGKMMVIRKLKKPTGRKTELREVKYVPWSHQAKMSDEEYEKLFGHPKVTHEEVEVRLTKDERMAIIRKELADGKLAPHRSAEEDFKTFIDRPWIVTDDKRKLLAMWNEDYNNVRVALRQAKEHEDLLDMATAEVQQMKAKHGGMTAAYKRKLAAQKKLDELGYTGHPFDIVSEYKWKSYEYIKELEDKREKERLEDMVERKHKTRPEREKDVEQGQLIVTLKTPVSEMSLDEKKSVASYMKANGSSQKEIADKFDISIRTVKRWTKGVKKSMVKKGYERITTDKIVSTGYKRTGYRKGQFTEVGETKRIPEGENKYKPGPGRPKGSKDKKPRKKRKPFEE